jgi:hypothetical protein
MRTGIAMGRKTSKEGDMWVFTQNGFFSVVAYEPSRDHSSINKNPQDDLLLVRGRLREDLEELRRWVPDIDIREHPRADYRFRAVLSREQWKIVLMGEVDSLDYRNFKNRVDQKQGHERHETYMEVWRAMRRLQSG